MVDLVLSNGKPARHVLCACRMLALAWFGLGAFGARCFRITEDFAVIAQTPIEQPGALGRAMLSQIATKQVIERADLVCATHDLDTPEDRQSCVWHHVELLHASQLSSRMLSASSAARARRWVSRMRS